jgi:thiosulfate dehydrogenase
MLRGVLLGIVLGGILIFAGIYLYFSTGQAPVTTSSAEMPFEHKFAHMALNAYLSKKPHPNPPIPQDEPNFMEGAKLYKQDCAVCHGLPLQAKTAVADGMFPPPPQLFRGMGVTDDEAWETYYKVEGGIRMTGMPGFKKSLSEKQMWQVSVLLKNADKLPDTVKAELVGPAAPPTMAPAAATAPGKAEDDHDHH